MKKRTVVENYRAVSPVVGVMLMLVVTIILAAVVSGFSGGLMGNNQPAPSLSMDIEIANTGSWIGSGFTGTVLSVSEPISTNDLKIITSWTAEDDEGKTVVGGATVIPGRDTDVSGVTLSGAGAPFGFGNGVDGTNNATSPYSAEQEFGNYTLMQGTGLLAIPAGSAGGEDDVGGSATSGSSGYGITTGTEYQYTSSGDDIDAAEYVLGLNWQYLQSGDKVQVNFIYMPTGKVIFSKEVSVTG